MGFQDFSIPSQFINSREALCNLLASLEETGSFDDVNFASDRFVLIKSGGRTFRLGDRPLNAEEVAVIACVIGGGANVSADVMSGRMLDPGFSFIHKEREPFRYRCNISSIHTNGVQGIKVALRRIPNEIPTREYTRVSDELFNSMVGRAGLYIVAGETGSGKSTTLASIFGDLIRNIARGNGDNKGALIITAENPIEYGYHQLVSEQGYSSRVGVEVFQHEVGSDFPDYGEAIRSLFRSNPDIVLIGEARDLETIKAALLMAMSGHRVYVTTHAGSCLSTITRLVNSFPAEEQTSAMVDFLANTNCIITQELHLTPNGRLPIREYVAFPEEVKRNFALCNSLEEAKTKFSDYFESFGNSFIKSAEQYFKEGLLDEAGLNHYKLMRS